MHKAVGVEQRDLFEKLVNTGTSLVVQWLGLCLPMQGGAGFIPGWETEIPHAGGPKKQNIKQKQYCNKFHKDLKNGPHQKIYIKKKERKISKYQVHEPGKERGIHSPVLTEPLLYVRYWVRH